MAENIIQDKDILFAGLNLPAINRVQVLKELSTVSDENWVWDEYRSTSMLPIMTKNGCHDKDSLRAVGENLAQKSDFIWTDLCPPTVKRYFEDQIFSWIKPSPRIVILKTPAFASNHEHIDCMPADFGSRQLKFRIVVSGKSSSLYFLTQNGNIHIPDIDTPFIIDGSWPHGMNNDSSEDKITICVGAPWTGAPTYPQFNSIISKTDLKLPENFRAYFNK